MCSIIGDIRYITILFIFIYIAHHYYVAGNYRTQDYGVVLLAFDIATESRNLILNRLPNGMLKELLFRPKINVQMNK